MIARGTALVLLAAAASTAVLASPADADGQRVLSTYGFSFLPPQGPSWHEQFDANQIIYLKQTNPAKVSFYTGALEGKLRSKLATKDDLVTFVRSKKDEWGNDGRYSDTSASFIVEDNNETCVRYRLGAHDRYAKNKGSHAFLVMQAIGRFCLHPHDRTTAVDIYYSVRYVPTFDPKDLFSEGEAFVQSLRFQEPK